MGSSSIEAPEETLRRLARERREAQAAGGEHNVAISWLLAEGDRLKAEHVVNLAAVLKRLIVRYLEYVLTVVRIGQIRGSIIGLPAIPLVDGIVETASMVREVARGGAMSDHLVDGIMRTVDVHLETAPGAGEGILSPRSEERVMQVLHNPTAVDLISSIELPTNIANVATLPHALVEQGIQEANRAFRASRRHTILAFARCLRSCIRRAIDHLPIKEREANSTTLQRR